jgi:hypothetical protein
MTTLAQNLLESTVFDDLIMDTDSLLAKMTKSMVLAGADTLDGGCRA